MPKRIKPYITQFFNRDKLAFTALYKCGHVTNDQLNQCGLADTRIKNYVRDGLVEKVIYKKGKSLEESYKLTKTGRQLAEKQWALSNQYNARSPLHDIAIANKYFELSEAERATVLTESNARILMHEKFEKMSQNGQQKLVKEYEEMLNNGLISMPDMLYTNEEGKVVSFEVITNNYGKEELQAKEVYVEIMETKYETVRV